MKGTIKMKLTEKQLEKIKSAKSAEEMIAFAKEEGLVLDEEKVNAMFAALPQNGELSDEQLEQVSGGLVPAMLREHAIGPTVVEPPVRTNTIIIAK